MNNIAISPHIFMYALQIQNVKRNIAKTADIKTLNNDQIEEGAEEDPNHSQTDAETDKMTTNINDLIPEPSSHIASVDVHTEIANEIQSYKTSSATLA
jgi:hypothetical protein